MNFVIDIDKPNKGLIQSDYLNNLREHFSVEDKNARIKQIKYGKFIPLKQYAITPTGRFDIGLYDEIYKYIVSLQIPFKLLATEKFQAQYKPTYDIKEIAKLKLDLRDYQTTAIQKCLASGRGIILLATAGGKTLIMASLVQSIRCYDSSKTLIIVPNIQLVEQTYNDFLEYGIDGNSISKWSGDNELIPNSDIIIASTSILQSKLTDLALLSRFKLVLIDECHKLRRGNEINNLLKHITTNHLFGFTGTMPEDKVDQWNIIGKIGPILFEKTSHSLREEEYISDAKIKVLKLKYKTKPLYIKSGVSNPTEAYEEENDFLYKNVFRNKIIAGLSSKLDNNTLVLVDRIEHGLELTNKIKQAAPNKKVYFIRGEMEVEDREKIRVLMEKSTDVVCVAIARIFSTGINIKNLHYIIFAIAGKAKVKILQSIGRGLRLHETKEKLIIFDIADDLVYGKKHLVKRIELYEKEQINYEIKEIKE